MTSATKEADLTAQLDELARLTEGRCAAASCHRPDGLVCVGDPYLALMPHAPVEMYGEGRLWLGCE